MTKQIRDEFLQHHEGQAIFTVRRVIFGLTLFAVAFAITTWVLVKESHV
jgi:hypothetical protein